VARIGAQHLMTSRALIEELATVDGHGLLLGSATVRAGNDRLKNGGLHGFSRVPNTSVKARARRRRGRRLEQLVGPHAPTLHLLADTPPTQPI